MRLLTTTIALAAALALAAGCVSAPEPACAELDRCSECWEEGSSGPRYDSEIPSCNECRSGETRGRCPSGWQPVCDFGPRCDPFDPECEEPSGRWTPFCDDGEPRCGIGSGASTTYYDEYQPACEPET